ncbi:Methionine synthase [uncultured delta proteobacterium]|uniref:Methionine synthase n=1 Tax=uncultured delta proteobacterium TaxID=34034 RepID=A0A212J599_9DELT|nr:Methionine synthase [uncultured delta proteobacterium]
MSDFLAKLSSGARLFFDGGLGTMLQARGLPAGVSPEEFCLESPGTLRGIHMEYAEAGADILTTNTFGGTRYKLPAGLDAAAFNRRMAEIAREAADAAAAKLGRPVFVAGSIGPSGKFVPPLGDIPFTDLVAAFREQIRGLVAGRVDLLLAETQFDIAEVKAIVLAARQECALPIGVSMTFENGRSLTGSSPEVFAATAANMGVTFIGTNCSAGPKEMAEVVTRLLAVSPVPVMAEPNAGLPELVGNETVFRLPPAPFAEAAGLIARDGVQLIGGCCGTTPDHIRALHANTGPGRVMREAPSMAGGVTVTSRSGLVRIGYDEPFRIIGERINPTGKKQLSAELAVGEFTTALRFADEQVAAGAHVLDVNVGAPLVDEVALLPELVAALASRHAIPLALDSSNAEAVAAALAAYPASPLVNSISNEPGNLERLGPLCRDYGAPFILLPLKGKKLPESAGERIAIIESMLAAMDDLGVPRHLALVDVLVLTVSANARAALECLDVVRYCREKLNLPTTAGLSNVSFGLPARELVNAGFLSMGAGVGLNACIANPGNARIREAVAVSDLLAGRDLAAGRFIATYTGWKPGEGASQAAAQGGGGADAKVALSLADAVILGRKEEIIPMVQTALDGGRDPFALVADELIPAITDVGTKYERKEYFLPQLIRSAETMQAAFAVVRPLLEKDARAEEKTVILTATVEGDIHDIGKNIVNLMLRNHGFEVIDLGKDVPAAEIVKAARSGKAAAIGLSALMTTTMVRMADTVTLLQKEGLSVPVMVGGAVVTPSFAESIGAHYSSDAVDAVRVARELTGK